MALSGLARSRAKLDCPAAQRPLPAAPRRQSCPYAEVERDDVKLARQEWKEQQKQWDANTLVFIDETGLNTKMTRLYGWAGKSQGCVDKVPHGHWHSSTFIAALRYQGICAPVLFDGSMKAESFLAYIKDSLLPQIRPGDKVFCYNLSSHKVAGVRQAIESAGASLHFLPAYSPDLNPIELAFAKLKSHLRDKAARTFHSLVKATAKSLEAFSPQHFQHFFEHCKYYAAT